MYIFDPVDRFCTIANNRLNEDHNLENQLESIENWIQAWSKSTHPLHLVVIAEMTYFRKDNGNIAYKPSYSSQIHENHSNVAQEFVAKEINYFDWDISKDSRQFLLCFYEKDYKIYKSALDEPKKKVKWDDSSDLIKKLSDLHKSYLG